MYSTYEQELMKKVDFVKSLNNSITQYIYCVSNIEYAVFKDTNDKYYEEYLVVTYFGGAISVRNCGANSLESILSEISKLVYGGYYDEVKFYQETILNEEYYKRVF